MDQKVPQPLRGVPRPRPVSTGQIGFMLTPKDVVSILRRHVLLMISLTILGFMVGGVSWYLLLRYAPKYTAKTFIRVLSPAEKDPMLIGGGVVGKDIQYGHRLSIASLIKQQSMLMNLLERDRIKRTKWFREFGDDQNTAIRIRRAFDDLQENLGVSALRDAEFVAVSMTCGDKGESALIVNELVNLFLDTHKGTKVSEVRNRLSELQDRRGFVESELAAAERALEEVRSTFGFSDLERRSFEDTITLRLNSLDEEEYNLQLTVSQLQKNIGNLEEMAQGPIGVQVENQIEYDSTMVMLTQQLFARKIQLTAAMTKFGENHRIVRELRELISDVQERRNIRKQEIGEQTRQANLKDAKDQLTLFESRLEEAERRGAEAQAEKTRLDAARIEYQKRLKIREQQQRMLNNMKEHIEKLRIMAEDPETAKVMSVGSAPEPLKVSSPLWYTYFPGGTFLGFALAVGLAFLLELLNDLLRTPRDVVRYINVPLLGVIPHALEDPHVRDVDLCHVVRLAPYSIISESYRRLLVNLKLSESAGSAKVLFISSCGAGDGKTAFAINLATSFIAEGKKVLLIDANFWRSMLHKAFPKTGLDTKCDKNVLSDFGLSNMLRGEVSPEQVIRPSGIENYDVIDSGPTPQNPTELLASNAMDNLIQQMRNNYDYVIIDGPPILLVSSAKVLAKYVDGSILVFNAAMTRRGIAQRAVRELREINAPVIGCVLMAARALKGGYFHEQFRSYQKYQPAQPAVS